MSLKIRKCSVSDLSNDKISEITSLVNRVYADAESGMWNANFQRTHNEEIEGFIRNGNLIFAERQGEARW